MAITATTTAAVGRVVIVANAITAFLIRFPVIFRGRGQGIGVLAFFIADVWSDQLHCRNSSHRPVGSEARVLRFRFGNQNNAVSKDSCSRRL
jgi:hypothetical protein